MDDTVHWTMTQVLGIMLFVFSVTILLLYYMNFLQVEKALVEMSKDKVIIDISDYKE